MAKIKLTKNELRFQQTHLLQLEKYLPTLQLKKAMLQSQVQEVRQTILRLEQKENDKKKQVDLLSPLLGSEQTIDLSQAVKIQKIHKRYENVAGVEVPYFEGIEFESYLYSLFETPSWIDGAIIELRDLVSLNEQIKVVREQKEALEKEWREVSIRVNLFEKILIPRAEENIRKIMVFLSDQQLAAVSRAKVAKAKIESKKLLAQRFLEASETNDA